MNKAIKRMSPFCVIEGRAERVGASDMANGFGTGQTLRGVREGIDDESLIAQHHLEGE